MERPGHERYRGIPGTYTEGDLDSLANRWITCPGCTRHDFLEGRCHTAAIVDEYVARNGALTAPRFVTSNGLENDEAALRDVYVTKDAVNMGLGGPRGSAHTRLLGIKLPYSKFANEFLYRQRRGLLTPEEQVMLAERREAQRREKREMKRREELLLKGGEPDW